MTAALEVRREDTADALAAWEGLPRWRMVARWRAWELVQVLTDDLLRLAGRQDFS